MATIYLSEQQLFEQVQSIFGWVCYTCTYRKCLPASQDEIKKKKLTNCQSLVCEIKREWKSFATDLATTLVRRMNNRISQVIKSDDDFILR